MATGTITPEEQKQLSSAQRVANYDNPEVSPTAPAPVDQFPPGKRPKAREGGRPAIIDAGPVVQTGPYRLPISLNPDTVNALADGDDTIKGYLQPAASAIQSAATALTNIDSAYGALLADKSLTEGLRMLRLEPGASKALDNILKTFVKANENLRAAITQIDQQLDQPVVSASNTPAAAELRSVLRQMSKEERNSAVEAAITRGDDALIHAALGAHPLASGLSPEWHAMMHRKLREQRHPDLMRRRLATQKAIELLERVAPVALGEVEKAARLKFSEMKGLKERSDASAAALAKLGSFPVHFE